jgi:fructokinase
MNVAVRLAALGANVALVSRVGDDDLGSDLVTHIAACGVRASAVQIDPTLPTGRVIVDTSDPQEVRYDIVTPAAWDNIQPPEHGNDGSVVVFGSLAARSPVSRATIHSLLERARLRVLDVNLRPPHAERQIVEDLLRRTDWAKLNRQELAVVGGWIGARGDLEEQVAAVAAHYSLATVVITLGAGGALMFHDGHIVSDPGFEVRVVDTVGCGDAFLATWLARMLAAGDPAEALAEACAVGALVATVEGAAKPTSAGEVAALRRATRR